ncbi:lipid IV(A) 3-deoxy-D-manno-octulosonic acid transferase [Idiomarina xiamenensis]|uniref:3-deoxy-D-manno-octulosonic acid kinase n=1 Tax=Idiomarina xiamenensis 10-D-4 TaxID=740709 RepID=K2K7U7_9GAMM|nr:lipid IV(A) 3-deoxy-D-manno-octulosonic acid transferase [Idiomarina xiamenensis]EKE83738.1 3-deoxy-D-manno-octulosonic-acid transferase [Idiomarina xiamenensis 10-D-4]
MRYCLAAYRLAMIIALPAIFAYLWWRGRRAPEYRQRWRERCARQAMPVQQRDGILIHSVSVGETVAARALIDALIERYPQLPITVTCMTPTASALIQRLFGERIYHCYLPLDSRAATQRFMQRLAPRVVLVMETELWPNLLLQAQKRHIPVALLNARLSARSARGYTRIGRLMRPCWQQLALVAAQTQATARRMRCLGVGDAALQVAGNLKFDITVAASVHAKAASWRQALQQRPVLVAASTHQGEDEQVLVAFAEVLKQQPDSLLILVPRHPERFQRVAQLTLDSGFRMQCRSQTAVHELQDDTQVLLGDSMGELMQWYVVGDACFVGGSLIERGGHNPLEPVAADCAVVSGRHVFNFDEIYRRLAQFNALCWATDAQQLAQQWLRLLNQPTQRQQQCLNGKRGFSQSQGATERMLTMLERLIPARVYQPGETDAAQPNGNDRTLKMMETKQVGKQEIWFDPRVVEDVPSAFFRPAYWQQQKAIAGNATGRSTVWFIQQGDQGMLLRHYYRGGLVGKVNKDRFMREPVANSRAMREFSLLLKLRELGLPVPRPIAASMVRCGLMSYRADILVDVIPGAVDVYRLLRERALSEAQWQTLGQAIRQLHDKQVYHSDLNCHNLMLDDKERAWVVDFDKCDIREDGEWKQANLQRLLRSLRKEQQKHDDFNWQEQRDWAPLLQGYQGHQ